MKNVLGILRITILAIACQENVPGLAVFRYSIAKGSSAGR
jgi:hypothetical protein